MNKHTEEEKTLVILEKTFQGGFGVVPFSILRNGNIPMQEKSLYLNLLSYAWYGAQCFPGRERLAKDLGISNMTLTKYLNKLKKLGLISWKRRGLNKTNIYFINEIPEKLLKSEADGYMGINPDGYMGINKVNEDNLNKDNINMFEDKSSHIFDRSNKNENSTNVKVGRDSKQVQNVGVNKIVHPDGFADHAKQEVVKNAIAHYLLRYASITGETHPTMRRKTLEKAVEMLEIRTENLAIDNDYWKDMINLWFSDEITSLDTDYNLAHFANEQMLDFLISKSNLSFSDI